MDDSKVPLLQQLTHPKLHVQLADTTNRAKYVGWGFRETKI